MAETAGSISGSTTGSVSGSNPMGYLRFSQRHCCHLKHRCHLKPPWHLKLLVDPEAVTGPEASRKLPGSRHEALAAVCARRCYPGLNPKMFAVRPPLLMTRKVLLAQSDARAKKDKALWVSETALRR